MNHSFSQFGLLIFLLMPFLLSCEKEDDGFFTPQVIYQPPAPTDTSFTVEAPCLTVSCAGQSMTFSAGSADLAMEFFASYDILRPATTWGALKSAIIVVHGNNRNANEYYSWMINAVLSMNQQDETIVIAPHFKTSDDIGGNQNLVYWSSNGWKRGFQSSNITSEKISSYTVIDSLIRHLSDKEAFPFLENIILTGHSAGAQFTHLYAAAGAAEDEVAGVDVSYVVANSQYFFYPGNERWDGSGFTVPSGCNAYTNWPYGSESPIAYLSGVSATTIRERFVSRNLTYLMGTLDIFTGGTLNTTDCAAVLLGENRFRRGELMFDYLNAFFASTHIHQKEIVNNVGHDAAQMYNSTKGVEVLKALLTD
ncbi:MAG: hypothetical protein AAFR61_08590 [Bacteroidota bacterium]